MQRQNTVRAALPDVLQSECNILYAVRAAHEDEYLFARVLLQKGDKVRDFRVGGHNLKINFF